MRKLILLTIFAFPIFLFYMIYKAHHDKIKYHHVLDDKIPTVFSGYRIFFISDIHRRKIRESTISSIDKQVDLVVIGGDLTEKNVPLERTRKNLQLLKQWNVPVYFVWGNNDYETDLSQLLSLLVEEKITVLANSNVNIQKENSIISLLGLDCSTYSEARIDLAFEGAMGEYTILLTHIPSSYFELSKEQKDKINVMLAGHTHGGQMRFLGFGPYERGVFRKIKKTQVLISEGYGYTLLPFRLGTDAECHVITIIKDGHKK